MFSNIYWFLTLQSIIFQLHSIANGAKSLAIGSFLYVVSGLIFPYPQDIFVNTTGSFLFD